MFEYLRYSNCILFADDTTIYVIGQNLRFLKVKLQADLDNLSLWLIANKPVLNVKKTKCMILTPRNTVIYHNVNLSIHGERIEIVDKFKFLGIWIDHHLEWHHQIQVILNKLAQNTYMIKSLKSLVSNQLLSNVYYAHINSHLQYGIVTWGSMLNNEQMSRIMKAQSVVLNYINNSKILNVKSLINVSVFKGQSPKTS